MTNLTGVYVGRLAASVTEEDLLNLFQQCGRILRVIIKVRDVSFRGPNIGFVKFDTHQAAKMAVADLNRWSLKGVSIMVDFMRAEHIFLKTLACHDIDLTVLNSDDRNSGMSVKPKKKSAPEALVISTDDVLYRTRLKDACSTLNSDIIHSRNETDSHLMDSSTILQEISRLECVRPPSAPGLIPIEGSEIQRTIDLLQQRKSEYQSSFLSEVDHLVKYLERQANDKASGTLSNNTFPQDSDNQNKNCSSINDYSFPDTDRRLKQSVSEVPDLLQTLISADQPKSQVCPTCDHATSNAQVPVLTNHVAPRHHTLLSDSSSSDFTQNGTHQLLANHSWTRTKIENLVRCKDHDAIIPNTGREDPKHRTKNIHAGNNQNGAIQCCTEVHNISHKHQVKSNPIAVSNDLNLNLFLSSSNEQTESCDSDEGYLVSKALRNKCDEESASAASWTDNGVSSIDAPTGSITLVPNITDLPIDKTNSLYSKAHSSFVTNNIASDSKSLSENNVSWKNKCELSENSICHAVFHDASVNSKISLIDTGNAELHESSCTTLTKEIDFHSYSTSQPPSGSCQHNRKDEMATSTSTYLNPSCGNDIQKATKINFMEDYARKVNCGRGIKKVSSRLQRPGSKPSDT